MRGREGDDNDMLNRAVIVVDLGEEERGEKEVLLGNGS